MTKIVILNTALETDNQGDHIIMDACQQWLPKHSEFAVHMASHQPRTDKELEQLKEAELVILCGTNALTANMKRSHWKLSDEELDGSYYDDKLVLYGVGWSEWTENITEQTKQFLNRSISTKCASSVRDKKTASIIEASIGRHVTYTACPTLWFAGYTNRDYLRSTGHVTFTLTDYRPHANDAVFLKWLLDNYDTLAFWEQGANDFKYLCEILERIEVDYCLDTKTIANERITCIASGLASYDRLVGAGDYIGSRLHGGIRAMQKSNYPVKIIAVDNRATEIGHSAGMPVIQQNAEDFIAQLENPATIANLAKHLEFKLPIDDIEHFKQSLMFEVASIDVAIKMN